VLLALDTATQTIGLGLHDGSQVLAEYSWRGGGYQTVQLAPEVALMLRRAGVSPDALTAVAVALGPGSYTGLRIGLALAKGLALARNLPLVGIPTMEILAQSQPRRSEPMLAVIKAGRGRIAGVWYKWGRRAWRPKGEAEGLTWTEVVARLEEVTYICGELDPEGREVLRGEEMAILAPPALCIRRPSFLAELAWKKVRSGKLPDPAALVPIYLKEPNGTAG
jgi:tRNA threonylcarbamoyladenosine biosynthesis protein TsaB